MPANLKHVKSAEPVVVHSIPCKIHADDSANVSSHFTPKIRSKSDDGAATASFRGFPLDGKEILLPSGYSGIVMNVDSTSGLAKNHKCSGTFDKITYWNWNKLPTKNDPFLAALDWIDVSQAIHEPPCS
uniref:Ribonuclease H2 subunit C n=1 Tax=Lygus hesperus TaxID=30085 RepID=A0A0A9W6F0_LYGHE